MIDIIGGMTFCDDHWNRLRELVVEKGMGGMIATDDKEIYNRVMQPGFPEPLLEASMRIIGCVAAEFGVVRGCVICELDDIHLKVCIGTACGIPEIGFVFLLEETTTLMQEDYRERGLIK